MWRTPRIIGRQNWEVALPNGRLTLLQIAIGIVDLSCCAAAMYMLVPDEPYIGFVVLAVIFVAATLLGFASHSPGGLGVFDAAMLVALWQYDKEDLLAGLLLFRLLYYITPFALALAILGGRELWLSLHAPPRRGRRRRAAARPATAEPTGPDRRNARDRAEAPSPVEFEMTRSRPRATGGRSHLRIGYVILRISCRRTGGHFAGICAKYADHGTRRSAAGL